MWRSEWLCCFTSLHARSFLSCSTNFYQEMSVTFQGNVTWSDYKFMVQSSILDHSRNSLCNTSLIRCLVYLVHTLRFTHSTHLFALASTETITGHMTSNKDSFQYGLHHHSDKVLCHISEKSPTLITFLLQTKQPYGHRYCHK